MTRSKLKEVVEKGVVSILSASVHLCVCVRDSDEIQLNVLHNIIILVTTSVILFICFLSGDSSLEHFAY